MYCKHNLYINHDYWHIIISALWLNLIAFSFIILKYNENSFFWFQMEDNNPSLIYIRRIPTPNFRVWNCIVKLNIRLDIEETGSVSVAGIRNIFQCN